MILETVQGLHVHRLCETGAEKKARAVPQPSIAALLLVWRTGLTA